MRLWCDYGATMVPWCDYGATMMSNLLDVDEAMISIAMEGEDSIAVFYDFEAAFPSVEHSLLHSFFRH